MNAFIRPLALGDFDGPSLAIEDTIAVAGLRTVPATDALFETSRDARSPLPRPLQQRRRVSMHAPAVRRALACGWRIDTRVGHGDFGAASAVSNAWVQAALAADFTGGLRVGAALHGICGFKPSYRPDADASSGRNSQASPHSLPMYCVGALAPDMQTLIDLAAAVDNRFDETVADYPAQPLRVGWLASDDCNADRDAFDRSYLSTKDWSKVHALLTDACQAHAQQPKDDPAAAGSTPHAAAPFPSSSVTVRLHGIAEAATAASLISAFAGRANDAEMTMAAPTPEQLATALRHANAFRSEVDHVLRDVDVIALPTIHASAGELDCLTRVFSLSGHPALTLPFTSIDGHLHGLQLIARHGEDARLCAAGRWFEALFARHPAAQRRDAEVPYVASHAPSTAFSGRAARLPTPRWLTARAG